MRGAANYKSLYAFRPLFDQPEPLVNGIFDQPKYVQTNGIRMATYEAGSGPPVIFLHGFPELAFSWRHQLPALAAAGFRAIAPDQRGYGLTDCPTRVGDYCIQELIKDVHGLLDALDLERATFVGHDWGALLLWQMSLLAPGRIERQVILNIPFHPRPATDPIDRMRAVLGDEFYIVDFQDSDAADRCFANDPDHFFQIMMRKNQITREQFDALPNSRKSLSLLKAMARTSSSGEPLLTPEEHDYYVRAYRKTGFSGPINWYRNWSANWEHMRSVEQIVKIPTLFIGARDDVVVPLAHIESMKAHVSDLSSHVLDHCGHWTQQERPDEVNALILEWLEGHKVRRPLALT